MRAQPCRPPCTTTQIGRPSPEGILYTSARDSLVVAWDLNIPMRNRVHNDRVTRNAAVSVGNSSLAGSTQLLLLSFILDLHAMSTCRIGATRNE